MKNLPDENRQKEIMQEIEIAEQKARDMADFAIYIAKKWKSRLTQKNKEEEIKF